MLTTQAQIRCQQRGIPSEVVELLQDYGTVLHRHGATVRFMDRRARREAREALSGERFSKIADRLHKYVVVADDGAVITAAARRRRLKF